MHKAFHHDENDILFMLFEHLPSTGDVQMFEMNNTAQREKPQRFGCFKLISDPPLQAISTLGSKGPHIFIAISSDDPNQLVPALASIEKADAGKPFNHGDHVVFDDAYLREHGKVGALFVEPAHSPMLLGFPSTSSVQGSAVRFFLTLFLDTAEHAHLLKDGVNAFLETARSSGKNFLI